MVAIQVVLLKIALDHRPPPASKGGEAAVPFARANEPFWERARPYKFWQWRSPKPWVKPSDSFDEQDMCADGGTGIGSLSCPSSSG